MSTHIVHTQTAQVGISAEFKQALISTYFAGFTPAEIEIAFNVAHEYGLSIPKQEIYFFKQGNKVVNIVGVHGLTSLAMKTGLLDAVEVTEPKIVQATTWDEKTNQPVTRKDVAVTAIAYRKDCARPTSVTIYASEFVKNTPIWREKQVMMLKKVAKCHVLRAAFSLGALYDMAELDTAITEQPSRPSARQPQASLETIKEAQATIPTPASEAMAVEDAAIEDSNIPSALHKSDICQQLQAAGIDYRIEAGKNGANQFYAVVDAGIAARPHKALFESLGFRCSNTRKVWWHEIAISNN